MAASIALKRARKGLQRKQAVGQKRKLALVESAPAARARKAAAAPIRHCLLHGDIGDGMANVIVAREASPYRLVAAFFLVDLYCLGIKDVFLQEFGAEEFGMYSLVMGSEAPLTPVDPAYARKLLRDAAAWAASIGFKPHRDFVAVEQIFGDVDANACAKTFTFGKDGRPFYVPGPTETRAQIRQRFGHLVNRLGEDGFDYRGGI